jgi:NAD(P)-dependent dehydrogenase (short-subunit alcohol dehydrogenase family)
MSAANDQVVVLTGANSGIGLALARALHAEGRRVACLDIAGDRLAGLRFIACDVTVPTEVESAIETVVRDWGRIDVLVNNACLAVFAPFDERDLEATRREFEVNYFGYVNLIAAVLPHMKAQGRGVIHNVGSTVGSTGFAGIYGYASTKGAIEALTRTLAIELAPHGIAVSLVHPPLTRTPSSAPLGVPPQFMADPADVGHKLARKIGSRRAVVTPGPMEAMGVLLARLIPGPMGAFLSARAAAAAREAAQRA